MSVASREQPAEILSVHLYLPSDDRKLLRRFRQKSTDRHDAGVARERAEALVAEIGAAGRQAARRF